MAIQVDALLIPYDSGFRDARMGAGPEHLVRSGVFAGREASVRTIQYAPDRGVFRGEIASAWDIQRWLATQVSAARERGAFPLVLAGNCMSAVGTFAGLRARSRKVPGVCWFDAHADFNTPETSDSGFLDGMALAALTGRCWTHQTKTVPHFRPAPEHSIVMFGTRSLDPAERKALQSSDIHWPRTARDSLRDAERLEELRQYTGEVYLHVDLDVLDSSEARANQFASAGGMTGDRLVQLVRDIGATFHIGAAAITAYDPSCDMDGRIPPIARDLVQMLLSSVG